MSTASQYEGAKIYADILNRNEISFLNDQDWANVYNIEDYSYTPDPDYPDEIETGKAIPFFMTEIFVISYKMMNIIKRLHIIQELSSVKHLLPKHSLFI